MSSRLTSPTMLPSLAVTGMRRKPPERIKETACSIGAASEIVVRFRVMTSRT